MFGTTRQISCYLGISSCAKSGFRLKEGIFIFIIPRRCWMLDSDRSVGNSSSMVVPAASQITRVNALVPTRCCFYSNILLIVTRTPYKLVKKLIWWCAFLCGDHMHSCGIQEVEYFTESQGSGWLSGCIAPHHSTRLIIFL